MEFILSLQGKHPQNMHVKNIFKKKLEN